jgi:DUF971 family protein
MDPVPVEIRLRKKSRQLSISYADDRQFDLSFEFLRVHSPSADVKGHGVGQEVLQTGKERVQISSIEPVGHYAIRLIFDDGHDTGLYTWKYLYELGSQRDARWLAYLDRLQAAGYARSDCEND